MRKVLHELGIIFVAKTLLNHRLKTDSDNENVLEKETDADA